MATFIDMHLPAIVSSVDKGTTPSTSTFRIRLRSLHNLSLGTRNTARPLSHIRPRCRSNRVGITLYLKIQKTVHADRATARRKLEGAANNCSRGSLERTATGAQYYESNQEPTEYLDAVRTGFAPRRWFCTHTASRSIQKAKPSIHTT